MITPLVILGCGGFGRETWCIAEAVNAVSPQFELLGVLDDAPTFENAAALKRLGGPVLGGLDWLDSAPDEVQAVVGIGSSTIRAMVDARWRDRSWATLVHPDATIGLEVHLSPGVIVAPGTRISTSVTVGRHAHLDQNVTVGHDCVLGDYTRLNPQACISGSVRIGSATIIGAGAVVLEGRSVGSGSVVGAGSVVTRPVRDGATVKGIPAK